MAPAAKRKKPAADDQSVAASPKSQPKRRKTVTDPTDSIETPPPTPKPAAAKRGRKPNAAKIANTNGDHPKSNGIANEETDDIPTVGNVSAANSPKDAPAVKPPASTAKRKIVIEDDDDDDDKEEGDEDEDESDEDNEELVNGQGDHSSSGAAGHDQGVPVKSETQSTISKHQNAANQLAKDSAPGAQASASDNLNVPRQESAMESMSPRVHFSDSQTIQPTTEPLTSTDQSKKKEKVKSKDREKRDKLYQYCIKRKTVGELFSREELLRANIADDNEDLLHLCQGLVTRFLFAAMTLGRDILYKTRSYDVAKKLASFSENHILIYSLIENAGRTGVWMRPLELKSGIHTALVRKAVRELVSSKVVQEIKSAETSKKTYISADVKPDEKHIGGGFMDEGKFDEGMINILTYVVTQFLQSKTWAKQEIRISDEPQTEKPAVSKHKSKTPGQKPLKAAAADVANDGAANAPATTPRDQRKLYPPWATKKGEALIPQHPNYYHRYPSAVDVMLEINDKKVIKDIVLTLKDTEQLLSKMEFDGFIERMRDNDGNLNMKEPRWRACKRTWRVDVRNESSQHFGPIDPDEKGWLPGNGLSQVPCARCPVKAKCKPGGMVSPEECPYLDDWLNF